MKKILILGGSHRDIPLINAAKSLGYFVITLGDRDYYLGHKYSDKSYKINFNDLDKVRKIIEEEKIDYLIPGCGEESYLNTVRLANELGIGNFDDIETAELVHNKWRFKEFCLKNDISTPKGFLYKDNKNLDELSFPIVVKPTNLSGGRGVEIVSNKSDLIKALENSKKVSNEIFLEEYINGRLIAYSVFIKNQKIIYGFIGEDKTYLNKYLISTAYPYKVDDILLNKMRDDIEKLSSKLNLVDGMFHLQILIKDNSPYIIDVTRRIPGDLYPYLIEYNDGVEYCKAVVNAYTTGNISDEFENQHKNDYFIIRHCVMPEKNGIYTKIEIDETIKDCVIYKFDLVKINTEIKDYLNTQIAIYFIKLKKNSNLKDFNRMIKVLVKDENE